MQSYIEFVWELVSISFTILIIDRIYQQQDIRREKAHLIRQLRSKDSVLAGEASEQLRAQGWLADGTLQGANLHQAILKGVNWAQVDLRNSNLEQATLARANLSEGNLTGTNLQGADLSFANLNGVKTTNQQLQTVFRLAYATMPNGERYNGRFHLPGDLQDAQAAGFNPNDITSMCRFYDISHKQYEL
ncbi:MAG: pentapeptide repeat-containing protein [Chloroflexi bacterium]|nr:pentapeptide repeat-containing protein [Chloroflexota bacterium]